jgi:hypothetical protein
MLRVLNERFIVVVSVRDIGGSNLGPKNPIRLLSLPSVSPSQPLRCYCQIGYSCAHPCSFQFVVYLSIYLSMALQPFVGPWPLFQFLDLFTQSVRLLGRESSPSQGRYLHIEQHKHGKTHTDIMPQVGFEPMIPVLERTKTVHALDRAATVMD